MTQRHIIGNTGPHQRISLRDLYETQFADEGILDEHQDLHHEVVKCVAEVTRIEEDEAMIAFHKRTQLESAKRKIAKIEAEVQIKQKAISRRQEQTKNSFSDPRQSQKIDAEIILQAQLEFRARFESLAIIQLDLDNIAQKVETLLEGLPETL